MRDYLKKLLGIGHKTKPVLMSDVKPAQQDPEKERNVREAVGDLIASLADLERKSSQVRRELSSTTIRIVSKGHR